MRKAIVIGSTGNIGAAICEKIKTLGYELEPGWDTSDRPDITSTEAFDSISKEVDLAVFAAGINDISPLGQTSNESWDRVVDVNLSAAFRFAKSMESRLVEGSGKLIFISSIMATHPYPNRLAYAASKGGLESLTRALAIEADGRFSTIAIRLGHVDALMASTKTNPKILEEVKELTPGKSLTSPKEVADLIAGILPSIKLLNGSIIDADRGYTLNRWPPGLAQ